MIPGTKRACIQKWNMNYMSSLTTLRKRENVFFSLFPKQAKPED